MAVLTDVQIERFLRNGSRAGVSLEHKASPLRFTALARARWHEKAATPADKLEDGRAQSKAAISELEDHRGGRRRQEAVGGSRRRREALGGVGRWQEALGGGRRC